jgi:hypothetical protein
MAASGVTVIVKSAAVIKTADSKSIGELAQSIGTLGMASGTPVGIAVGGLFAVTGGIIAGQ